MSLFVINRYQGEERQVEKDEKDHLSELLQRIEERKRQRAEESQKAAEAKDAEVSEEPPRKKKKKKKKDETTEDSLVENNIPTVDDAEKDETKSESQTEEQKSKKKKKRKKLEENLDAATENDKETEETSDKDGKNLAEDVKTAEKPSAEESGDFMVLGVTAKKKKREVKRVLPDWLAHPEIISADLGSGPSLEEVSSILDPKLANVLRANGIEKLFPVQHRILSWLQKCNEDRKRGYWLRDTCVSAPTGSGKTLAYVLPIVQNLQSRLVPKVRCLVVVPVQELAAQVHKVITTYTTCTDLKVALLSGASSFEQERSNIVKKTNRGQYISAVDIVVATPGRLVDHILKTEGFCLDDLKFLVIDEADRASEWLQYIPEPHYRAPRLTLKNLRCSKMPAQKLLFSATLSQDPEKLNRLGLLKPILFTSVLITGKDGDVNLDKEMGDFVGRYTSPEELTEIAVECSPTYKPVALYELLNRNDVVTKTLVFTNSGETAHRLALLLRLFLSDKNVVVDELSAQLAPKQRESVLQKFASGEIHVLVSSDALARGVDIPDVQLVVSYDLPKHIKGYIHRAGRTGRAGKAGTAVSILTSSQIGLFKHMLNNAHKTVPDIEKLELEPTAEAICYATHVEKLRETLEKEKQESLQRVKAVKRV